ncbi:hypothetical protein WG915_04210 [Corynebacterium sp. H128]|uniref:hypothetical protein n=1 Tax=Corynebacterium sp. H128 TaxID=3133427 RepID=UPI0030B1B441
MPRLAISQQRLLRIATVALCLYLVGRAITLAMLRPSSTSMIIVYALGSFTWVLLGVLLRPLAPIVMTMGMASYIIGMGLRIGYLFYQQPLPTGYVESGSPWPLALALKAVAIVCLAFTLWQGRVGHRMLWLLFLAFAVAVAVRVVCYQSLSIAEFSFVNLLRDLLGGGSYFALAITLYFQSAFLAAEGAEAR